MLAWRGRVLGGWHEQHGMSAAFSLFPPLLLFWLSSCLLAPLCLTFTLPGHLSTSDSDSVPTYLHHALNPSSKLLNCLMTADGARLPLLLDNLSGLQNFELSIFNMPPCLVSHT